MSAHESTPVDPTPCCGRRQVLKSAALAAVGAGALGACGGQDSGSGDPVQAADVPVGGALLVEDQKVVVSQPTKGTYAAYSIVCTHAGCPATELSGTTLTCPCHGSQFDALKGTVVKGPATTPLEKKSVSESGGTLSFS